MTDVVKYEDIPELTDKLAAARPQETYTYIINAAKYQETGEVEVKRVLKEDLLPEASASYVFFKREGCHGYPLNEADLTIHNGTRYVGPFQMDGPACNVFLKHIKETHPEWKQYITGQGTDGYMNFVKKCPDKQELLKTIEDYALSDYFNNRAGRPDILAENLAIQFQKTDENNQPVATRMPLHVIASLPTGVIARGNGNNFNKKIPAMTEQNIDEQCKIWISDPKRGVAAYNILKEVNYLTPEIIAQYQTMNLSGAEDLQAQYLQAVSIKEQEKQDFILAQMKEDLFKDIKLETPNLPNLIDIPDLYGRTVKMDIKIKQNETNNKTEVLEQENKPDTNFTQEETKQNSLQPPTPLRSTREID